MIGGILPDNCKVKESDLALPLGITYDKLEAIDYSDVIDASRVRFFTSKPKELSKMLAIIFPFGLSIWIALVIAFILTGLCFYLILNWNSRKNQAKHVKLYDIFWAIFGSFSNKGSSLFEVSGYCRIMVFGWLIAIFIIVSSYSGGLMSFLAFAGYEYVPETFPELIKEIRNGHYTASYVYNMDLADHFKLATQETPLVLALKKLRTEGKVVKLRSKNDVYEHLMKPKHAFIEYELDGLLYVSALGADDYLMSKDSLYIKYEVYGMIKGFPYKKEINIVNRRIIEAGLDEHAHTIQLNLVRNEKLFMKKDDAAFQPLSIENLIGAFVFLFIGYVLSTLIFLMELAQKLKNKVSCQ
ncbi:glutamate receptor ionotropic, delta-2-like [Centruroides sculpturatus]|uniref:glutamate receptor ionotropic, delta-2-like n=1 Tax=Centruroides sculpturatus TaxID=218467 RepID=UPI000C6D64F5|nr:glutamate receptor ionotropic, delta-2-like [Centruroides sculpturatus]